MKESVSNFHVFGKNIIHLKALGEKIAKIIIRKMCDSRLKGCHK